MTRRTVLLVALGLFVADVAAARADDYSWNTAVGGNWSEAAKWTRLGGGTGVPGAADTATIDLAGTYVVDLTDNRAVISQALNRSTATLNHIGGTFTVGPAGAYSLAAGTYTLGGGATLTLNGAMSAGAGSALNFVNGTWSGTGSAAITGAFSWSGGTLGGSGTVTASGAVALAGGSVRTLTGTKTLVLDTDAAWSGGQLGSMAAPPSASTPGGCCTTPRIPFSSSVPRPVECWTSGAPSASPARGRPSFAVA